MLYDNEKVLALDNLYEVFEAKSTDKGSSNIRNQEGISLGIKGGGISIYASNSQTQPASLAEMTLATSDTDITGVVYINIAKYIAIVQASGTVTEVIATNLEIKEDLGAII